MGHNKRRTPTKRPVVVPSNKCLLYQVFDERMPWQKGLAGREPGVASSNFFLNGLHSEELTNGWVYHFGFTIESVMLEKLFSNSSQISKEG